MKVALVLCPSWGIETPHLGIALLVASLRNHGFQVETYDFNLQVHNKHKEKGLWKSEEDVHWEDEKYISQFVEENDMLLDSFVNEVISRDARVIGFSIYNTTNRLSLELAKRIKRKDRDKIIIFGGQQCFSTESAEWLIKNEAVDAIVRGEGDEILPELIGKIEKLNRIDFCPGIIYKENGEIINCGLRPPISNLDHLPFPDFSDFALKSYDNPHQLPILSSRGCCYQCVFCSTKLFWIIYRSMSGERIFREIEYQLKRYNDVNFFTFNDHVINADIQRLFRFCDLVLEAKAKNKQDGSNWETLRWRGAAVIRPEMDRGFLKKMREAGCIELEYGIESGSSRLRKAMKKFPESIEVVERVMRDTYEAGISVRANFMFGFPGESEKDFQDTLDLLKRNKDVFAQVHPSETFCHIDPNTDLFNHHSDFKVQNVEHPLFWMTIDGQNTYPERLRRHQVFCELANSLNIPLSPGGHKIILHKEHFLKEYFSYRENNFNTKTQRFLRLFIDVTNKCNLKCIMCRVHSNNETRVDMTVELYKKIAISTFPYVKELWLSCAYEAFIVNNVMEMFGFLKDSGIPVSRLVTNGTLLNETNISGLINIGLGYIYISMEGAQKITYEKFRRGADFGATLSKIELLNSLKERFSSSSPEVCFMVTLMRSNIEELPQLVMLASRLRVREIAVKAVDVHAAGILDESLDNYKDQTIQCITEAKKLADESNIVLSLTPELQDLLNMKEDLPQKENRIKRCNEVQPVMYIFSDGKIKPCPLWRGSSFGDFNSQDFWQIWDSTEFKKWRFDTASGNFREECVQCRWLI